MHIFCLAQFLWVRKPRMILLGCCGSGVLLKLQSSEVIWARKISAGCWREAAVPFQDNSASWWLEHPHHMAGDFPQSKKSNREQDNVFYYTGLGMTNNIVLQRAV
jgi:hypothetical protein